MSNENGLRPLHIFFSFADEDQALRDELDTYLTVFERTGLIDSWHTHQVLPGDNWQDAINARLDQADIILLIVTKNFIASNYCYTVQLSKALAQHEVGQSRVIPLRFHPIPWDDLPFAKLQELPISENKAVSEWLNQDLAYMEILEGIKKVIEDMAAQSRGATAVSSTTSASICNLPYTRNAFFTGRDELLASIHRLFSTAQEQSIMLQVVSGLAGIGKTQIALEYVYRYRNEYQILCWLKGDTIEDLRNDFLQLARLLNLPERNEADHKIVIQAIKRALTEAPRWLLIIDNLEDFTYLTDLIPPHGQGHILITTRRQATGATTTHNLEQLSLDEGILLLLKRARLIAADAGPETIPTTMQEEASAICQEVASHPLALDQAGAYLEETRINLARYLALYQKHAVRLLKQRRKFATGHPDAVAMTFTLCLDKVKAEHPACMDLLAVCTFLHPDAIPDTFFSAGGTDLGPTLQALLEDELDFHDTLALLFDFSLLQSNPESGIISIHRLLQIVIRDMMDDPTQQRWTERVITVLSRLFPESELGAWPICQLYLPHALVAANFINQWQITSPEAARLLYRAGSYLYDTASYTDARRLCEQALAISEQLAGEQSQTAQTLHCLGNIYESLDKTELAQDCYERTLVLAEQVWGTEDMRTARLLNDLGEHFQSADQLLLAEDYYQRALTIRQEIFGSEHPETASSLNNMAGIYDEQGRYELAQPLYEQALSLRRRIRGLAHPETAESLSNTARFYRVIGKYSQAQPLYEEAIIAYEQTLGPQHPRLATCYNNFAVFCITLGQYEKAAQLLTQALEIRTQVLGTQHPSTAGSWNHLGRVYYKQGRYEQAWTLYQQALAVCEEALGRKHASTGAILVNIGELYLAQGNDQEAEALLTEVRNNVIAEQGSDHPEVIRLTEILTRLQHRME